MKWGHWIIVRRFTQLIVSSWSFYYLFLNSGWLNPCWHLNWCLSSEMTILRNLELSILTVVDILAFVWQVNRVYIHSDKKKKKTRDAQISAYLEFWSVWHPCRDLCLSGEVGPFGKVLIVVEVAAGVAASPENAKFKLYRWYTKIFHCLVYISLRKSMELAKCIHVYLSLNLCFSILYKLASIWWTDRQVWGMTSSLLHHLLYPLLAKFYLGKKMVLRSEISLSC